MLWISRSFRFEVLLLLFMVVIIVAGCDENLPPIQPGPSDSINDEDEIMRYFPMNVGDIYRYYTNVGLEFVYETVEVQERFGGPAATIEVSRQGVTSTQYKRWSGKYLLSTLNDDYTDEMKDLVGPFHNGADWRRVNDSSENVVYYIDCEILDLRHSITVEAGTFETMLVQQITHREFPPAPASVDTAYYFYTADVGIVKMDFGAIVYDLVEYIPGQETSP